MNTSISYNDLPPKEREVADLYVYGLTKKEIAVSLNKAVRTVENQVRALFAKTDVHKDTEFARWYFCTRFNITFDISPLSRAIAAACLLLIVGFNIFHENNMLRSSRAARGRVARVERSVNRKNEA